MSYIAENCTFAPITDELLARLKDFYCHHETDISDFFKFKAVKASEELMSKSYCLYDDKKNEMVAAFCVLHTSLPTEHLPNYARRNINKKVKYEKQRKHYPATLIGQFAILPKSVSLHLFLSCYIFDAVCLCPAASMIGENPPYCRRQRHQNGSHCCKDYSTHLQDRHSLTICLWPVLSISATLLLSF